MGLSDRLTYSFLRKFLTVLHKKYSFLPSHQKGLGTPFSRDWRDVSVAKCSCCSCGGLRFSSQSPHPTAHNDPGSKGSDTVSSGTSTHVLRCTHRYIHKNKINLLEEEFLFLHIFTSRSILFCLIF